MSNTMRVPITLQDVAALFEIASRSPKTAAEELWFRELLNRWNQSQAAAQAAAEAAQAERQSPPADDGRRPDLDREAIPQARGDDAIA